MRRIFGGDFGLPPCGPYCSQADRWVVHRGWCATLRSSIPPPVAGEKRQRVATSRWQARALDEFDSAVRVARRDGVT